MAGCRRCPPPFVKNWSERTGAKEALFKVAGTGHLASAYWRPSVLRRRGTSGTEVREKTPHQEDAGTEPIEPHTTEVA